MADEKTALLNSNEPKKFYFLRKTKSQVSEDLMMVKICCDSISKFLLHRKEKAMLGKYLKVQVQLKVWLIGSIYF